MTRARAALLAAAALLGIAPALTRGPLAAETDGDLASVRVPIRLYEAERDEVLRHAVNAERIRSFLPRAGHYVFLAPCSAAFRREAPPICVDPPGVDRAAIHDRLNAEIVDFVRRTLP